MGRNILTATFFTSILLIAVFAGTAAGNVAVTELKLHTRALTVVLGETEVIRATVVPDDATDKEVRWVSSDPLIVSVVSISDSSAQPQRARVKAMAPGSVTITAIAADGKVRASCLVEVEVPVQSISVLPGEVSLNPNESISLEATIHPEEATEQGVTWESTVPSVASVDSSGMVVAHGPGQTNIIARSLENHYINGYCLVTVADPLITNDHEPADEESAAEDQSEAEIDFLLIAGAAGLALLLVLVIIVIRRRLSGNK